MFELAQIGESEVVFHPVSALVDQFGLGIGPTVPNRIAGRRGNRQLSRPGVATNI